MNKCKEYYRGKDKPVVFIKGIKYFLCTGFVGKKANIQYIYCNGCSVRIRAKTIDRHWIKCPRNKPIKM